MKKKYMEPQMIVEDFTVSEMVAADCMLTEGELKVVTQMPVDYGCDSGREDKYVTKEPRPWPLLPKETPTGKGTAYAFLSDLFNSNEHDHDLNQDGHTQSGDSAFVTEYAGPGVCEYDPIAKGTTFGFGYVCNDSTSALQKS